MQVSKTQHVMRQNNEEFFQFMKSHLILSGVIACTSLFVSSAFANTPQQHEQQMKKIYSSKNIQQGLIDLCVSNYTKAGALEKLTKTEVSTLCRCNIESQGRMTEATKWKLQSAQNAKDEKTFVKTMDSFQKAESPKIKKCLGQLAPKLEKLMTGK